MMSAREAEYSRIAIRKRPVVMSFYISWFVRIVNE